MLNDAHSASGCCRRAREIGRRVIPSADASGMRHLAVEALICHEAEAIDRTRRLPDRGDGLLADDGVRAVLEDALGLGWTLWGCAPNPQHGPSKAIGAWEYADWLVREVCRNIDSMLLQIGSETKVLAWYEGATMTSRGPHYENFDKDTELASPRFDQLPWQEAFVIDQTMTVAFEAEGRSWCDDLVAGLRPALESMGGPPGSCARMRATRCASFRAATPSYCRPTTPWSEARREVLLVLSRARWIASPPLMLLSRRP